MNGPSAFTEMTAILYCTVTKIAALVDFSWNGIFWDRACITLQSSNLVLVRNESDVNTIIMISALFYLCVYGYLRNNN